MYRLWIRRIFSTIMSRLSGCASLSWCYSRYLPVSCSQTCTFPAVLDPFTAPFFFVSHACRASDPFPLMVAIPDRCCLRNYRNNRVEWPIVVQQEPLPAHAVPYAVRLCRSSSAFTVTLSMKRDRISTTIMAPSFLIAANFIILGRITRRLGPQFCRLSPLHCE